MMEVMREDPQAPKKFVFSTLWVAGGLPGLSQRLTVPNMVCRFRRSFSTIPRTQIPQKQSLFSQGILGYSALSHFEGIATTRAPLPFFHGEWFRVSEQNRHHHIYLCMRGADWLSGQVQLKNATPPTRFQVLTNGLCMLIYVGDLVCLVCGT